MTVPTPPADAGTYARPSGAYADPGHRTDPFTEQVPGRRGIDVGEVSVGELIGNVTRDLSTLMRQELALAQAELKHEATKTGKAAGALGGAAFAGYFVVLFGSIALWAGLSNLMDAGWAALIVAVLWAVVAAVLFTTGRDKLRQVHPKPERTVDTLNNVPDALRGHAGGTS